MYSIDRIKEVVPGLKSPAGLFMAIVAISLILPSTKSLALAGLGFWGIVFYGFWTKQPLCRSFFRQPEIISLILFCSYCLISLLWSPWENTELIVKEVVRVAIVSGLVFLFGFIAAERKVVQLDLVWIAILSVAACYLLIDFMIADLMPYRRYQKLITESGLFYHHAPVGWMFALVILLAFPRILSAPARMKTVFIAASLLALVVLVLAQSRGAYVGLVAGLSAFALLKGGRAGVFCLVALIGLAAVFTTTYFFADIPMVDSLINRADASRRYIYMEAMDVISQAPWFGHGFGATSVNSASGRFTAFHFHNVYLGVLFYGGVAGLLLMAVMTVTCLVKNFKYGVSNGWYSVLVMALVIFLVDGNHFVTYPSAELYIFLVPLLVMAAIRVQRVQDEAVDVH